MAAYSLPDLPYDYGALQPAISAEILELHHSKHHAAYVTGANDASEQLSEVADKATPAQTVGLQKTLAFNLSGHVLHSIFWQNLSPHGGELPEGHLATAIDENFGSFQSFSKRLTLATTSVQGSGWGVLAYEPLAGRLIIEQVYDHHGNVGAGTTPLLVFDAWEHAYYLQYKNVRPDYVARLWGLVNWNDVSQRHQTALAAAAAPTG
jgi:Fe-Mn family superoxide dismutase